MRVFEHCEACPAPCGGGSVTRLMRTGESLIRRCNGLTVTTSPRRLAHRDARSDHGYLTTEACEWPQCERFEHCEACHIPWGGVTVTRSMRRVANATLLRFDRYDVPLDLRTETPDPITDI